MRTKDINTILENTISDEIKKAILSESKDYYHVMSDNQPIETFESHEEAKKFVDKHTGKNLIIDKKKYGSYDEMIDALDEMSENINENKNIKKMRKNIKEEMSSFDEEWMAKDTYDEEYSEMSPHDKFMGHQSGDEEMSEMDGIDFDTDKSMDSSSGDVKTLIDKYLTNEPEEDLSEDGMCMECGDKSMEEDESVYDEMSQYDEEESMYDEESMYEGQGMCNECGSMLNEEGMCMECGMKLNETKSKKIRLKESELVSIIKKMVMETIPGLTVTNKSREGSKKIVTNIMEK
jgi:hypothetical protein